MIDSGEEEDEAALWLRPVWKTEDEAEPPGKIQRRPSPAAEPNYTHPLLSPLARAQDAVARFESHTEAVSSVIAEGLRARLSYREAAGWLAYSHVWIHPRDLALRDARLTSAYGPAALAGRLNAELPATTAHGSVFEVAPSDVAVDQALRLAQMWRRLAELRTWNPLADTAAVQETLRHLGCGSPLAEIEDWLTGVHLMQEGPPLIRAARLARDWMNRPHITKPLTSDGIFLAACLWRQSGNGRAIALPFWLAPELHLNRLALQTGIEWLAGFLNCMAEAARAGLADLVRLQTAADKAKGLLTRTARSKLPAAFEIVLRTPVMTVRGLADRLDVSPQAALGLLRQLLGAGVIREATGRSSWRAFVTL